MSEYNVFLSWSGPRSKAMAAALEPWLRRVIQSARPYFSDKIEAGGFWDDSIKTSLKSVHFAIICCTPENIAAPWLNYEAGAMAERMEGGTVPWLLEAKPEALQSSPLSRLMARTADKPGTLSVVQTLNGALGNPVGEQVLLETFDDAWPKLDQKLKGIPALDTKAPLRPERDMLEEVVRLCRQIEQNGRKSPQDYTLTFLPRIGEQRDLWGSGSQGPQGAQGPQAPATLFNLIQQRAQGILASQGVRLVIPPEVVGEIAAELNTEFPGMSFSMKVLDEIASRIIEQRMSAIVQPD